MPAGIIWARGRVGCGQTRLWVLLSALSTLRVRLAQGGLVLLVGFHRVRLHAFRARRVPACPFEDCVAFQAGSECRLDVAEL